MIDKDQLAADQAALNTAQAADDAAKAALVAADTSLGTAATKLAADTAAYDAEQAKIAANPVLGVLDEMETTVNNFDSQVGVGVSNLFRALIAKARAFIDPQPADASIAAPAPVADPVVDGQAAASAAGTADVSADASTSETADAGADASGAGDQQQAGANDAPAGRVIEVTEPITLTPAGDADSPPVG